MILMTVCPASVYARLQMQRDGRLGVWLQDKGFSVTRSFGALNQKGPSQLDTAEADYGSVKGNILNTFLRLDPKDHLKNELNIHQLMDVFTEIIQE